MNSKYYVLTETLVMLESYVLSFIDIVCTVDSLLLLDTYFCGFRGYR